MEFQYGIYNILPRLGYRPVAWSKELESPDIQRCRDKVANNLSNLTSFTDASGVIYCPYDHNRSFLCFFRPTERAVKDAMQDDMSARASFHFLFVFIDNRETNFHYSDFVPIGVAHQKPFISEQAKIEPISINVTSFSVDEKLQALSLKVSIDNLSAMLSMVLTNTPIFLEGPSDIEETIAFIDSLLHLIPIKLRRKISFTALKTPSNPRDKVPLKDNSTLLQIQCVNDLPLEEFKLLSTQSFSTSRSLYIKEIIKLFQGKQFKTIEAIVTDAAFNHLDQIPENLTEIDSILMMAIDFNKVDDHQKDINTHINTYRKIETLTPLMCHINSPSSPEEAKRQSVVRLFSKILSDLNEQERNPWTITKENASYVAGVIDREFDGELELHGKTGEEDAMRAIFIVCVFSLSGNYPNSAKLKQMLGRLDENTRQIISNKLINIFEFLQGNLSSSDSNKIIDFLVSLNQFNKDLFYGCKGKFIWSFINLSVTQSFDLAKLLSLFEHSQSLFKNVYELFCEQKKKVKINEMFKEELDQNATLLAHLFYLYLKIPSPDVSMINKFSEMLCECERDPNPSAVEEIILKLRSIDQDHYRDIWNRLAKQFGFDKYRDFEMCEILKLLAKGDIYAGIDADKDISSYFQVNKRKFEEDLMAVVNNERQKLMNDFASHIQKNTNNTQSDILFSAMDLNQKVEFFPKLNDRNKKAVIAEILLKDSNEASFALDKVMNKIGNPDFKNLMFRYFQELETKYQEIDNRYSVSSSGEFKQTGNNAKTYDSSSDILSWLKDNFHKILWGIVTLILILSAGWVSYQKFFGKSPTDEWSKVSSSSTSDGLTPKKEESHGEQLPGDHKVEAKPIEDPAINKLEEAIKVWAKKSNSTVYNYKYVFADLNGKSPNEAVVLITDEKVCKSGCLLIFEGASGGHFKAPSKTTGISEPISKLEDKSNGWQTLLVSTPGGGAEPEKKVKLQYDGTNKKYPSKPNMKLKAKDNDLDVTLQLDFKSNTITPNVTSEEEKVNRGLKPLENKPGKSFPTENTSKGTGSVK